MIHGLRNLPYEDKLKRLNLQSLERRKSRGDLFEVHKWMALISVMLIKYCPEESRAGRVGCVAMGSI